MEPFEDALNDKLLYIVIQDLCWLLVYDMLSENFISKELKDLHREADENFSMNFAQLDKKIINSTIIFAGKFMKLWSTVVSATILSFLLIVFAEESLFNNIPFVVQIEKYINTILIGIPPQNMKEFHRSVLGLISKEVKDIFPMYIRVSEPESKKTIKKTTTNFHSTTSKNLIRKNSKKQEAKISVPQNHKPLPKKISSHDRSGLPIAQAIEVFKKADNIINNYKVERTRQLFDICAQEELYVEAKEVPPITPLGITFEDFPQPHLPPDYYNPRAPRRRNVKRAKSVRKPKNAPKRRYRVIPEPEETMETIARAHEYLTENPVYLF